MKKKILLVLVLATAAAGGVFGQAWYNSYASGIEGSKIFINAGVGYVYLPYKMSLPPISGSVEYGLSKIPLSLGAYFGITMYDGDIGGTNTKGTLMGVGARASYHFNFIKNLDPYVTLVLGWLIYKQEVKKTVPVTSTMEHDLSTFLYGFHLGTRYFFTKNIGIYAELGWDAVSIVSAGLSLKF